MGDVGMPSVCVFCHVCVCVCVSVCLCLCLCLCACLLCVYLCLCLWVYIYHSMPVYASCCHLQQPYSHTHTHTHIHDTCNRICMHTPLSTWRRGWSMSAASAGSIHASHKDGHTSRPSAAVGYGQIPHLMAESPLQLSTHTSRISK